MRTDWEERVPMFERSPQEQSLLRELYSYIRSGCRICLRNGLLHGKDIGVLSAGKQSFVC